MEVDVPPGGPLAEALGPPAVLVHSALVGSSGTVTCNLNSTLRCRSDQSGTSRSVAG